MSNKNKIQIWLRPDQLDCVVKALEFSWGEISEDVGKCGRYIRVHKFASGLACERIEEILSILNTKKGENRDE